MVVQTPSGPKTLKKVTWEIVAIVGMFFLFTYGVLQLGAQHFDFGEWRSTIILTAASAGREIAPYVWRKIQRLLEPTTDAFSRGGQIE